MSGQTPRKTVMGKGDKRTVRFTYATARPGPVHSRVGQAPYGAAWVRAAALGSTVAR